MWIKALLARDLKLAWRGLSASLLPMAFLLICASLFPMATNADVAFLKVAGAPVILLVTLLASLLSLEHIFAKDMQDATIDQMLISGRSFSLMILVRTFIHWLTTLVPVIILAPIPAIMYGLDAVAIKALMLCLILSTPTLALLGALGSALLTGSKQGNILLALIVLPLYIPLMIFAGNAVATASIGGPIQTFVFILLGFLFTALALVPYAANIALKQAVHYE